MFQKSHFYEVYIVMRESEIKKIHEGIVSLLCSGKQNK